MKIWILVKNVGKSWSWSTFSENFDFSQYLRKSRFGSKFSSWFWSKLNIMLILVKFSKDFDLGQTFTKNSIRVKFFENIDFGWNCRKNFKFGQNLRKISILVQLVENCRFWPKLSKMMKILILVKIFEKCRLGSKLTKLSISDKTEKDADFSESFKKTFILVKIFENLDLVKIIEKSWFWSKW